MMSNDYSLKEEGFASSESTDTKLYTTEYASKCNDLEECICQVYAFFMWYGSTPKSLRNGLFSILFLESMFLQVLLDIKHILEMRSKGLHDELTDKFRGLLAMMNDQMHRGISYIRSSSIFAESELPGKNLPMAALRQDVTGDFSKLADWLKGLTHKPQNKILAKGLIDELGLNYQKRLFGVMGDSFELHTNMVMNALMLLAVPSHSDASQEKFAELFKNSYGTFCRSSYCKEGLEVMWAKAEDYYLASGIVTNEQKMLYLKKLWGEKKTDIRTFLEQRGVNYTNLNSNENVGKMGQRLYHALNADANATGQRMSNDDLCLYFLKEAQLASLATEIERLKLIHEDPTPGKAFFAEHVKRAELRKALYKTIYEEQGLKKNGEKRYVLGAQGHWIAVLKVMQAYDMVRGTITDFANLMNEWYPLAPHPCDYRSMIAVRAYEVKSKPYPEWSKLDKANYPYLGVADTFIKYLREYNLVK